MSIVRDGGRVLQADGRIFLQTGFKKQGQLFHSPILQSFSNDPWSCSSFSKINFKFLRKDF